MKGLNEREIVNLFVHNLREVNPSRDVDNYRQYFAAREIGNDDVSIMSPAKRLTKGFKLVFKSDMLMESTDAPPGMRPWQIARKSVVSCVSDFSAKGIKPFYISLISIGIPSGYSPDDILDLVRGFKVSSKEMGVNFVGGDTNESSELVIDCSMIGFSDSGFIPSRSGAAPNDFIVVSGEFGYPPSGLKILNKGAKATGTFKRNAISSVIKPKPQQKFGISLAKCFSSSMDSSDGLATSLYELAIQSKANFFITKTPSAKGIKEFANNNNLDYSELVFHGGEEYHIVATIPADKINWAEKIAKRLNLRMLVIGRVTKGDGKVFLARSEDMSNGFALLDNRGYLHLSGKHKR